MIERYYNGPQSALMDELYDRLTEHGDPSEYPDWPSLSLYIAREIQQIEINHHAEIATLKKEEIMPAPERFLSDEGMNVYDAAIKVIGELKAEIAKRNTEIATLTEKYLRAGAIAERFKEVT